VIKGIEMTALNTRTAEIAAVRMVGGHIAAFGPDAFTAQLLGSTKRVAVAGAAVAYGVQSTLFPIAICGMHQSLLVGPADKFFGLVT
jgi:hypothetical protein